MNIQAYPRVLPTAYLSNLTGSVAHRNKVARTLSTNFKNFIYEIFDYKKKNNLPEELTLNEIQRYYDFVHPNIVMKIVEKDPKREHSDGYLGRIFSENNNIEGFFMGLKFQTNAKGQKFLPKKNILEPLHEDKHFNIEITNPKSSAKQIIFNNCFSLKQEKQAEINNFYRFNIYEPEIKKINLSLGSKERCKAIRKNIKEFFKKNNFSSEEKIAILQHWRHKIKGEIIAYREGFNDLVDLGLRNSKEKLMREGKLEIKNKDEIIFDSEKILPENREKELAKILKEKQKEGHKEQRETFLFPEKLKILDSLLAREIRKHRKIHAKQVQARVHHLN